MPVDTDSGGILQPYQVAQPPAPTSPAAFNDSGTGTLSPTPSTTPAASTVVAPSAPNAAQPSGSSFDFELSLTAADIAADREIQGPNVRILAGETVEISPLPTNSVTVAVGQSGKNSGKYGPNRKVGMNSVPRPIAVKNLCELYLYAAGGAAGDGIAISIRGSK